MTTSISLKPFFANSRGSSVSSFVFSSPPSFEPFEPLEPPDAPEIDPSR
eukprot:CAMPEP_0180244060 /NCGR_PEP_ID=MMETSP0987-20121128/34186_1 /TAXON_ID=697907 /ORGANISM="non described non described, Strain CCMP2293" /LENGTH=48 /DNA_ID= /DNA_START= /DNA_END= /DNA_ORIENTATION=